MSTFNKRLAAVAKSYRNSAFAIQSLAVEAIEFAKSNDHNPVQIQKVLDIMDGKDINHMSTIIKALGPFNIDSGTIKVRKTKEKAYPDHSGLIAASKSFRGLAMSLGDDGDDVLKPFDLEKYVTNVLKRLEKEGVDVNAFESKLDVIAAAKLAA